jgi:FMN-dependent NADH-azoreductase
LRSRELIHELLEADEVIVGTPMYNFAIPAVLKAWIDHVVRFGKTFKYGSADEFMAPLLQQITDAG